MSIDYVLGKVESLESRVKELEAREHLGYHEHLLEPEEFEQHHTKAHATKENRQGERRVADRRQGGEHEGEEKRSFERRAGGRRKGEQPGSPQPSPNPEPPPAPDAQRSEVEPNRRHPLHRQLGKKQK